MKAILIVLLALIAFTQLMSQEIIQWRGVDRTGYFPSENLLTEWPLEGPELLLHITDLPETYSSIVVKDDVMYTTGISDTSEIISAIKMDGTILWNTVYGKAWGKSYRNGRCTPTIEGDYAYLISGGGYLSRVNITSGELDWSIDGLTTFEGEYGKWGVAESPLLVDDKMIYSPCGDKTTVVAVDKTNGETIWMSESLNEVGSYVSPTVIEKGDLKLIVTVSSNYVLAINASNGNIIWKYKYTDVDPPMMGGDINPVTPLVVGNEIFVTSGYNHVAIMLETTDDWKSVSLKWKNDVLDVHHGGVVAVDGYIYGANYTSIRGGDWVCLKWDDGTTMFQEKWNTKGQIIATDGYLICYDERMGNVALVEINPAEFRIKSTFKIEQGRGPHWTHPTIYNDQLFIRHGADLMVYRIGN